eukprot:tig00020710_g13389.t1
MESKYAKNIPTPPQQSVNRSTYGVDPALPRVPHYIIPDVLQQQQEQAAYAASQGIQPEQPVINKGAHPIYKTSNQVYGARMPDKEQVQVRLGLNGKFTTQFVHSGMYKEGSLKTGVYHSKVHKTKDGVLPIGL